MNSVEAILFKQGSETNLPPTNSTSNLSNRPTMGSNSEDSSSPIFSKISSVASQSIGSKPTAQELSSGSDSEDSSAPILKDSSAPILSKRSSVASQSIGSKPTAQEPEDSNAPILSKISSVATIGSSKPTAREPSNKNLSSRNMFANSSASSTTSASSKTSASSTITTSTYATSSASSTTTTSTSATSSALTASLMNHTNSHISFLFKELILELSQNFRLSNINVGKQSEITADMEGIIKESSLYAILRGVNSRQVPLRIKDLLLTFLGLNEYKPEDEDDIKEDTIIQTILVCFRLLVRDGHWGSADSSDFFEKLYHGHKLRFGYNDMTPVLAVVDEGPAAGYLSEKSQKFMDKVADPYFRLIANRLMKEIEDAKEIGDISDSTQKFIAKLSSLFFTLAVGINYKMLKRNIYKIPILGKRVTALAGLKEFREITIRKKYMYMRALRELHLSCFAKTQSSPSNKINSIEVIDFKDVEIDDQNHTVSFAIFSQQGTKIIKAIKVTCHDPAEPSKDKNDVYMFVQEFENETPEAKPDPNILLSKRSLYKIELIPNSPCTRMQEASDEVEDAILESIKKIQVGEKKKKGNVECLIHTAIWHKKELMLVEILRQCGLMLSSRALYGKINTFVKKLRPPPKGYLSVPNSFEIYQKQLRNLLIGAFPKVMNAYVSRWPLDDILKPLSSSSMRDQEWGEMKAIKEHSLDLFDDADQPGKWLLKSIMSCCYGGDPKSFTAPENATVIKQSIVPTLQFKECKSLLNTALKWKKEQVVLSLVNAMVKSLLAIMKSCKEKSLESDLKTYFKSEENFPLELIPDIINKSGSMKQKASRLIYIFFQNSLALGIEATKEQKESIKDFLNLKD